MGFIGDRPAQCPKPAQELIRDQPQKWSKNTMGMGQGLTRLAVQDGTGMDWGSPPKGCPKRPGHYRGIPPEGGPKPHWGLTGGNPRAQHQDGLGMQLGMHISSNSTTSNNCASIVA